MKVREGKGAFARTRGRVRFPEQIPAALVQQKSRTGELSGLVDVSDC
jgi:hypothetical protein